jgi:RNA polymerase sigma-70 factor (ECF subfamily)
MHPSTHLPPDDWYVLRARSGRPDAFEELVRRHKDRVYRLAVRMVGEDFGLAEDVAQETFVQAWRSLPRFRADSQFGTWLYRIAVNRSLNAKRRCPSEDGKDGREPLAGVADPERTVEARSQLEALTAAVAELTPDQRSAFVLREVEGLHYEQIAQILGVSPSAVKSRLYRARVEILQAMAEWT